MDRQGGECLQNEDDDACRKSLDVSETYIVKLLDALDSRALAYIAEEEMG